MANSPATEAQPLLPEAAWLGWTLALWSLLSTSIVPALARSVINSGLSPTLLLFLRLGWAFILLIISFWVYDRQLLFIDRRGLRLVSLIGFISGVEICSFFYALAYMDASIVAMLKTIQPLAVLLLLRLRGEPLTHRHWIRLLLAIIGVYLLVGPGGQLAPMGLFLVFCSVILYALQLVLTQWYLPSYHTGTVTIYLLALMTFVTGGLWWVEGAAWQDPGYSGWVSIGVLAVVSTYLARLALYAAIPRVGSGQISMLWPLQMLLAVIFSMLLLQERLGWFQWLGGGLILLSALLAVERLRFRY